MRNAYIRDIDAQRLDVGSRHVLHHHIVLDRVAHNEDNEALPLEVKGEGLRERQGGRAGDDDDLEAAAVAGAAGAAGLPAQLAAPHRPVRGVRDGQHEHAAQDLVPHDPVLGLLERRRRDDLDGGRRRHHLRTHVVGEPGTGGEGLPHVARRFVYGFVDIVGDLARVAGEPGVDGG